MIGRLALRSLIAHPVRSAVLAGGFGLGVGVMAILLGVGEVILEQAQSPALVGGGDVVLSGAAGQIPAAKWVLSSALRSGGAGTARRRRLAKPSGHAVSDSRRPPHPRSRARRYSKPRARAR